jgi:hypothetical protein
MIILHERISFDKFVWNDIDYLYLIQNSQNGYVPVIERGHKMQYEYRHSLIQRYIINKRLTCATSLSFQS